MSAMASFPTQARAVIIGGGIIGCSTAYHLARLGWGDVVLLERKKLTSGSTFHAAVRRAASDDTATDNDDFATWVVFYGPRGGEKPA